MVTVDDLREKERACNAIRQELEVLTRAQADKGVPLKRDTSNVEFENKLQVDAAQKRVDRCEGEYQAMQAEFYRQQLDAERETTRRTLAALELQAKSSAIQATAAEETAATALRAATSAQDSVRAQWGLIGIGFATVIFMIVGIYVQIGKELKQQHDLRPNTTLRK